MPIFKTAANTHRMQTPFLQDEVAPPARSGAATSDTRAVRIALKVVPGSRREEVAGMLGERLKIRVSAPPEDGKANRAVCRVLAEALGADERDVTIVVGTTNPEKVARVAGMSAAEVRARLTQGASE
ncbi:MAG: DUF167 domain-containing protein [Phycisphaerales bacterium]